MSTRRQTNGYVFLIAVIVIGSIAAATTVFLMLLGWAAEQNGQEHVFSNQAREYASVCIERSFESLRKNLSYTGNAIYGFTNGSCSLGWIGGSGNTNRTMCAEGRSGKSIRRLQVTASVIFPSMKISSWKEVTDLTCGTSPNWTVADTSALYGPTGGAASSGGGASSVIPTSSAGSSGGSSLFASAAGSLGSGSSSGGLGFGSASGNPGSSSPFLQVTPNVADCGASIGCNVATGCGCPTESCHPIDGFGNGVCF